MRTVVCTYKFRDGHVCGREITSDKPMVVCTGEGSIHRRRLDCGCIYDQWTEKVVEPCEKHEVGMTVLGMHGHELVTDFRTEHEARFEHSPSVMVDKEEVKS